MNREPISVCIATYNGEKYIKQQISSIIRQISSDDEIIIVDDKSSDNTMVVLSEFPLRNIHTYQNNINIGAAKTFERAISIAKNDIIFLSDQDDEWAENKVECVLESMEKENLDIVIHDGVVVNDKNEMILNSIYTLRKSGPGILKNFIKDTHMGSCMAFRKRIVQRVLPIPSSIGPTHDLWIGLMSEILGFRIRFIPDKLIIWRRHIDNTSTFKRRRLTIIILNRMTILYEILKFLFKRLLSKV